MSKREQVRQVVLKAMRSKLVMFSEGSIADDATERIMEIFEPGPVAPQELDHDLGPALNQACC